MTTRQLRHCSAHVNINEGMFCNSYELVSYSTPVALLGMIDGTIIDDNGVEHEHHGMALLLGEDYPFDMVQKRPWLDNCEVRAIEPDAYVQRDGHSSCVVKLDYRG